MFGEIPSNSIYSGHEPPRNSITRIMEPGFRKVDLHIHTPESMCYSEKSATAQQIVDSALEAILEAIAITDHNSVGAIEDIRQAATGNGLTIFPGIEITARGGHVIALFEPDTPIDTLEDFLSDMGFSPEQRGDAAFMADGSIEDVFEEIDRRGGIVIAAHIERWPSGFLQTNEPRQAKMKTHSNQHLSALEITIPQNREQWNNGQVRGYPKKYACIQGSDAHAPDEIGRRPVYIKMAKFDLDSLRVAFDDHQHHIVFPNELNSAE